MCFCVCSALFHLNRLKPSDTLKDSQNGRLSFYTQTGIVSQPCWKITFPRCCQECSLTDPPSQFPLKRGVYFQIHTTLRPCISFLFMWLETILKIFGKWFGKCLISKTTWSSRTWLEEPNTGHITACVQEKVWAAKETIILRKNFLCCLVKPSKDDGTCYKDYICLMFTTLQMLLLPRRWARRLMMTWDPVCI